MPKRNKGLIKSKRIEDLYPYTVEVYQRKLHFLNRCSFTVDSDSACELCLNFSNSMSVDEIYKLITFTETNYPTIYNDLSIRLTVGEPKLWISVGDNSIHPPIDNSNISKLAFDIVTNKMIALLNLRHPRNRVVIDHDGVEKIVGSEDNSLAALAQFVVYVLYNQLNWSFMFEGGAQPPLLAKMACR